MAIFQFWKHQIKFLLIKLILEDMRLLVKNPHFWSGNSEIENLPLIYLPIYKKIFIWGLSYQKCRFFTNKTTLQTISDFEISV
jgi:hypothetical protein